VYVYTYACMIIFQHKIVIIMCFALNFVDKNVKLCSTRYYMLDFNVSPIGDSTQLVMFISHNTRMQVLSLFRF
jgi:hypothetical protein